MKLGSALAIYALFWTMTLFMVLPFGVRTAEEAGVEHQPGHAESAPHGYNFGRTYASDDLGLGRPVGAYYLNYVNGWITAEMLDWST
jgi:predicted secreted protein